MAGQAEGLFVLSDDVHALERLIESGSIPLQKLKLLVIRPERTGAVRRPQEAARRLGVRMLADVDTVFLDRSDHSLHQLQLAVKKRILLKEASRDPAVESCRRGCGGPMK